jgi:hypothetical protein
MVALSGDKVRIRSAFRLRLWSTLHKPAEIRPALRSAQSPPGYLLRSNLTAEDPAVLWTRYIQLTNIEAAFRSLKSDLGLRPIHIGWSGGWRRTQPPG